jgi:hypothetical protein
MKNLFDCCNSASIYESFSQGSPITGAGMKFNLNEDGSKYTRFLLGTKFGFVLAK